MKLISEISIAPGLSDSVGGWALAGVGYPLPLSPPRLLISPYGPSILCMVWCMYAKGLPKER